MGCEAIHLQVVSLVKRWIASSAAPPRNDESPEGDDQQLILKTAVGLTTEGTEDTENGISAHLAAHPSGEGLELANFLFFLCELCALCGELLFQGSFGATGHQRRMPQKQPMFSDT